MSINDPKSALIEYREGALATDSPTLWAASTVRRDRSESVARFELSAEHENPLDLIAYELETRDWEPDEANPMTFVREDWMPGLGLFAPPEPQDALEVVGRPKTFQLEVLSAQPNELFKGRPIIYFLLMFPLLYGLTWSLFAAPLLALPIALALIGCVWLDRVQDDPSVAHRGLVRGEQIEFARHPATVRLFATDGYVVEVTLRTQQDITPLLSKELDALVSSRRERS